MKTELTFLVELFLDDDLPKPIKDRLRARIEEVEKALTEPKVQNPQALTFSPQQPIIIPAGPKQAPSTLAAMARHAGLDVVPPSPPPAPEPVAQVAQTGATAAAMAQRANAIAGSLGSGPFKGKPGDGRTSPRKW